MLTFNFLLLGSKLITIVAFNSRTGKILTFRDVLGGPKFDKIQQNANFITEAYCGSLEQTRLSKDKLFVVVWLPFLYFMTTFCCHACGGGEIIGKRLYSFLTLS